MWLRRSIQGALMGLALTGCLERGAPGAGEVGSDPFHPNAAPQLADLFPELGGGAAPDTPELDREAPAEITFVTEGRGFAPVLIARGPARALWLWSDGTQSDSLRPTKRFTNRASRRHRLRVEPWSAVRRINIGYDGRDGGDPTIEHVADQRVSAVFGLEAVAPHLEEWCSSGNQIRSLDFSHFQRLRVIECHHSRFLRHIALKDTPRLQRACLEDVSLTSLDLSESPALTDLRGALNAFPDIAFGDTGENLSHLCIRDNPQLTNRGLFTDGNRFTNLAELFAWNTNQSGTLAIHSTHPDREVQILVADNAYDVVDLTGALQAARGGATVDISRNAVSRLDIAGCTQLKVLNAQQNRLDSAAVDAVLAEIDAWNTGGGTVDLRDNAIPSATGDWHRRSLESRGWRVAVDSRWSNLERMGERCVDAWQGVLRLPERGGRKLGRTLGRELGLN